jgi:hypothetical protein
MQEEIWIALQLGIGACISAVAVVATHALLTEPISIVAITSTVLVCVLATSLVGLGAVRRRTLHHRRGGGRPID